MWYNNSRWIKLFSDSVLAFKKTFGFDSTVKNSFDSQDSSELYSSSVGSSMAILRLSNWLAISEAYS